MNTLPAAMIIFLVVARASIFASGETLLYPPQIPEISSQTDDSWGKAVDGIQIKLILAKDYKLQSGELPRFELQVRNIGKTPVSFSSEYVNLATQYEIDSVWFGGGGGAANISRPPITLAPSVQSSLLPLAFRLGLFELDPTTRAPIKSQPTLTLKRGTHTVRARVFIDPTVLSRPQCVSNSITVQTN